MGVNNPGVHSHRRRYVGPQAGLSESCIGWHEQKPVDRRLLEQDPNGQLSL